MRLRLLGALALSSLSFAACASGDGTGAYTAATGRPHVTSSAAAAAASSGSAAGGSSGATGAATTTGTAVGATTSGASGASAGSSSGLLSCSGSFTACDTGQVELLTQAIDAVTMMPISQSIAISDLDDASVAALSGADGLVQVCTAPGTVIAPELDVTGYVPTIFNDIGMTTSDCLRYVPLLEIGLWNEVIAQAQMPPYDSTQPALIVSVVTADGETSGACDKSGWTFQIFDPDGGLEDGGLPASRAYIDGTSLSPTAVATTASGGAILYNIALGTSWVQVVGSYDAGATATFPCGLVVGAGEYTGAIHLAGNGVTSSFTYVIADAG